MFDIGFWELALIGIVALLVVGPEKMPTLIRTAGQWVGQIQRMARDLRREIELEAHTDEFKALNSEFLAEDKRLKDLARAQAAVKTGSTTPADTDAELTSSNPMTASASEAEVSKEA